MLIYRRTSLLESSAQTLVNTVNCVGVMGKGLAQAFKEREPTMFAAYKRICDDNLLEPGKLWLWRGSRNWVLNFPTKVHWRQPSRLEWVKQGLEKFVSAYEQQGITEISFPKLGCGNGNLDWENVKPLMEEYLGSIPIKVYIHDFTKDIGIPEHIEEASKVLKTEHLTSSNFDDFNRIIRRLIDVCDGSFIDLDTRESFKASLVSNGNITIETHAADWQLDEEAIRGIWLELQSGILTKERAGWVAREAGTPILSMISLLPGFRGIEIQRKDSKIPELAVEKAPASMGTTPAERTYLQTSMPWR